MSLFKRFKMIMMAKGNTIADRAENPTETIELGYQQLLEQQRAAKSGLTKVVAAKKGIERQMLDLGQKGQKLQAQAEQALQQGNEPLARKALEKRSALEAQLQPLKESFDTVSDRQANLEDNIRRFDAKLESFKTQKEVTKARYASAQAEVQINEAFTGIGESAADIGLALERAEAKTAAMEDRAAGMNELVASGALDDLTMGPRDDIQAELDATSATAGVDSQLEAMKAKLALGTSNAKEISTSTEGK